MCVAGNLHTVLKQGNTSLIFALSSLQINHQPSSNGKNNSPSKAKFETIEILRGLAALIVALFHLTDYGKDSYLNSIPLSLGLIPKYGWVAIAVFFVISGFVIPYSLWRKKFQLKSDWYSSLTKRIIRIYPAYLATILLIIGFGIFRKTLK